MASYNTLVEDSDRESAGIKATHGRILELGYMLLLGHLYRIVMNQFWNIASFGGSTRQAQLHYHCNAQVDCLAITFSFEGEIRGISLGWQAHCNEYQMIPYQCRDSCTSSHLVLSTVMESDLIVPLFFYGRMY